MTEQSSEPTAEGLTEDEREAGGRLVREVWIEWAREQPIAKLSWLVPWEGLSEPDREVDRRIAERLTRDLADRLAAVQAERERRVTENDSEFLMRTLTPHQWEVIGRKVRAEVESAEAERDAALAALDRVKTLMRLGSKSRGYWQSADGPGSVSGICEDDLRAAVEGGRS